MALLAVTPYVATADATPAGVNWAVRPSPARSHHIAHGTLGDQQKSAEDYTVAERELRTNLLSVISLLTPIANYFEEQKSGVIAVISSVAGDRGRQSNYVYGTAKGGLNIFLQGLRNRLNPAGVCVLTIKPGFVDTPMTEGIKKNPLFASPETIAKGIYTAIAAKRDIVYLPWFWFWIALAIAAVVGLVSWLIVARRRRARSATDWQAQVIDAYAKGSALHDAMAAAETPGALAADNAGLRWSDIQRRADDYSQLLYHMQQTAPGDQERLQIADLIASLQAARSAMDAERSGGIPDGSVTGLVRDRLAYFAYALNLLRQPDARSAGPAGSTGSAGPV